MFGNRKDDKPEAVESTSAPVAAQKFDSSADARTQIGPGTVIKGEVDIKGEAIIHGTVEGSLTASGAVDVNKGGLVKANLTGKSVRVAGRVEGKIVSAGKVQLVTGAHVKGDIHSQSLKIEEGVFFQGACVMSDNPLEGQGPKVIPIAGEAAARKFGT
jgi:cytoskeletal protein CcmA (bactofilin family)